MKKINYFIVAIGCIFLFGCKKDKAEKVSDQLYGNWKLTETMFSPGGPGEYIQVKEEKYALFEHSGKITGNALPKISHFKIFDNEKIVVFTKNPKQNTLYSYVVSVDTLELILPCIEACRMKFIKQ